jgi:hypothetical protein
LVGVIDSEEGLDARYAESDEILGHILVDGMVAAEITGEWWNQLCGEEGLECCGRTHESPTLGYVDDDDNWIVNLAVWPKRPERVPIGSIVVTPYTATESGTPPYLSNIRATRHLEGPLDDVSITSQQTLEGQITTDQFVIPTCGGYLEQGEKFALKVKKGFGHVIHGLVFDDLKVADGETITVLYGEGSPQDDVEAVTDSMGAFDCHIPYQGEAFTAKVVKGHSAASNEHPLLRECCSDQEIAVPVRQRRMSFCGIAVEASDSLKYCAETGALIYR